MESQIEKRGHARGVTHSLPSVCVCSSKELSSAHTHSVANPQQTMACECYWVGRDSGTENRKTYFQIMDGFLTFFKTSLF